MTTPTFTAGQRVYHRQRREYGIYVQQDWVATESIVNFNEDDDWCRVTTAQLVAADQVEENG
jgi:hypothetical protein